MYKDRIYFNRKPRCCKGEGGTDIEPG